MDGQMKATRHDLAENARKHYEFVSTEATDWLSTIPKAIDAWEREPTLTAAADALANVSGKLLRQLENQLEFDLHEGDTYHEYLAALKHYQEVRNDKVR